MIIASKYTEICCAHRIYGHPGKCNDFHGHNYKITIDIVSERDELDKLGMLMDFNRISEVLGKIEAAWDHKFLVWGKDPYAEKLGLIDLPGLILLPFSPSAENMAKEVCRIAMQWLEVGVGISHPYSVVVHIGETTKCEVTYAGQ